MESWTGMTWSFISHDLLIISFKVQDQQLCYVATVKSSVSLNI